jgi:HAMP domain-containing protein
MFVSPPDGKPELGVTLATPLKDASGKLSGVLSADFTLASLTRYLKRLPLSAGGTLCIIEETEPGNPRILAHTNPALVGESLARDPAMAMAEKLLSEERLQQQQELTTVYRSQEDFLVSGAILRRPGDPSWRIYGLTPRSELMAPVHQNLLIGLGVSLIGVLSAVWVSFRVARQITTPILQLTEQAENLALLSFAPEKPQESPLKEIGLLQEAMGKMQRGLQTRLSDQSDPVSGPVTVGLLAFDTQNAALSHKDITEIVESFLPLLEGQGSVFRRGSFEIVAIWQGADQVEAACRAVRQCQKLLQERLGGGPSPLQAALHHSPAPGSSTTEIATLLRRLVPLNAIYGTQVLVTAPLLRAAPFEGSLLTRPAEKLRLGSGETLMVEELLGVREESDELLRNLTGLGRSVMEKYLSRDFAAAESQARASLSLRPSDPLMRRHLANALDLQRATPPDGWDGSRVL